MTLSAEQRPTLTLVTVLARQATRNAELASTKRERDEWAKQASQLAVVASELEAVQ